MFDLLIPGCLCLCLVPVKMLMSYCVIQQCASTTVKYDVQYTEYHPRQDERVVLCVFVCQRPVPRPCQSKRCPRHHHVFCRDGKVQD